MKNWKTTILGIIGSILTFFETYQANGGDLKDWKLYAFPLLIAAFGALAKDHNVTGGSLNQNDGILKKD